MAAKTKTARILIRKPTIKDALELIAARLDVYEARLERFERLAVALEDTGAQVVRIREQSDSLSAKLIALEERQRADGVDEMCEVDVRIAMEGPLDLCRKHIAENLAHFVTWLGEVAAQSVKTSRAISAEVIE